MWFSILCWSCSERLWFPIENSLAGVRGTALPVLLPAAGTMQIHEQTKPDGTKTSFSALKKTPKDHGSPDICS